MPVGSKMLYTGEMQAFPYLFRPIEPVSRLLELYIVSAGSAQPIWVGKKHPI